MQDEFNNVEQVWITHPEAGFMRVTVRGEHIPTGNQSFALVVTGNMAQIPFYEPPIDEDYDCICPGPGTSPCNPGVQSCFR